MRADKGKQGWKIPTVITPTDFFCLRLRVPNQSEHLDALYGTLQQLGYWFNWRKDGTTNALLTAQNWQKWLQNMTVSEDCDVGLIYDLRQTLITIERKITPTSDWSLLYDPSPYVILKTPSNTYHNIIQAPVDERALWAIQNGGEMAIVGSQSGSTGRVALLAHSDPSNTDEILLLERPTSNAPYLNVRVNSLVQTVINRYGQLKTILYSGTLPTANIDTFGAVIYLRNSANTDDYPDGAYIGAYSGSAYFWSRFAGENGVDGATPDVSLDLFLPDWYRSDLIGITADDAVPLPNRRWHLTLPEPFLLDQTGVHVTELTPSEVPFASYGERLDLELDTRYQALYLSLPRAAQFDLLDTIVGEPGSEPDVAMSADTNGDYLIQFTLPASADSGGGLDPVPPLPGTSKTYRQIVLAAYGTIVPFLVPAGCTLESISAIGLWSIFEPAFIAGGQEFVSDADGYGSGTPKQGLLQYGVMLPTEETFEYFGYTELPLTFEDDTYLKFRQNRSDLDMTPIGYIEVEYIISRPADPPPLPRYQARAAVGEFATITGLTYLGDDRWLLEGVETTGNPAQPGRIALDCIDSETGGTPIVCFQLADSDLIVWTPASSHNRYITGSCSVGGTIQDTTDAGNSFMDGAQPMERFDFKFISGNLQVEFTIIPLA